MKSKAKAEVKIFIDEQGNVGCDFSSNNLVTVLGMIEMGKMLIQSKQLEVRKLKDQELILPPEKRIIL